MKTVDEEKNATLPSLHPPAAGRSALYLLLSRCLNVPGEEFYSFLGEGLLGQTIGVLVSRLPYTLTIPELSEKNLPPFLEFHSAYLACFEVGRKGPACPLYEGAFRKDRNRKAVFEDLLRFYDHFGLRMSQQIRELPDFLLVELEFMHYLSFLEGGDGRDRRRKWPLMDLRRAQRDFLQRHLAAWTPGLAEKAGRNAPPPYPSLLAFLNALVQADLEFLTGTVGST